MRELKRIILFCALIIIPILAVDYYVDSYASFRLTYKMIGRISVDNNYSVGTDIPLSERKAKWGKLLYIEPVDNMILGSSRSMLLSSQNLNMDSFYNLGISAGSAVRDYMAEASILYSLGKLPKKMLIEVSPSIFNANSEASKWIEWGENYEYMDRLLQGEGENRNRDDSGLLGIQYRDIMSPGYFKYNLEQLIAGKRAYIKINNSYDDIKLPTQHVDGSYAYSKEFQEKNDEQAVLDRIIAVCDNKSIYQCSEFQDMDSRLVEQFQQLISFLISKGVNVSFYLPPYAEYMYDYICNEEYYQSILNVEDYIIKYAEGNGIQVYGSYNPEKSNLELKDFYDEYHIKPYKVKDTLWVRNENMDNQWAE